MKSSRRTNWRDVEDLLEYEKEDALARRLVKRYGIAPAKADELAE